MSKRIRLTNAQHQWLDNLAHGENPWDRIHGMSAHGGACCTVASLQKRGYLSKEDASITDAGREAIGAPKMTEQDVLQACANRLMDTVVPENSSGDFVVPRNLWGDSLKLAHSKLKESAENNSSYRPAHSLAGEYAKLVANGNSKAIREFRDQHKANEEFQSIATTIEWFANEVAK